MLAVIACPAHAQEAFPRPPALRAQPPAAGKKPPQASGAPEISAVFAPADSGDVPAPADAPPPKAGVVPAPVALTPAGAEAGKPVPAAGAEPEYASLLFSRQDVQKLNSVAHTYELNTERDKLLAAQAAQSAAPGNAPGQPQGKAQSMEHPQFYLSLIAYRNENSWTLWLNKHPYTSATKEFGDITVLWVEKSRARFLWKPRLFPIYQDRLPPDNDPNQVTVQPAESAIEFTLYANQSFSAYSMQVVEGYLPPVRVEQFNTAVNINDKAGQPAQPGQPGEVVPPPPVLPELPSSGLYDTPGKDEIVKELNGR